MWTGVYLGHLMTKDKIVNNYTHIENNYINDEEDEENEENKTNQDTINNQDENEDNIKNEEKKQQTINLTL